MAEKRYGEVGTCPRREQGNGHRVINDKNAEHGGASDGHAV